MALSRSPDELTLLHNPRCSKSRALKAALEERGMPFLERNYLEAPLSRDELDDLRGRLDLGPEGVRAMVRAGEPQFAAAGLTRDSGEEQLLDAIASHPELLQRPVLVRGERAAIGRPTPDPALDLL